MKGGEVRKRFDNAAVRRAKLLSFAACWLLLAGMSVTQRAAAESPEAPDARQAATAEPESAALDHQAFVAATRSHGLPPGAPIPSWASAVGAHAYFAPASPGSRARSEGVPSASPNGIALVPGAGANAASALAGEGGPETEGPPTRPRKGGEDELGLRAGEVPPVRYHEGGLIQTEPKLRVIFWGSNFNQPTGSALREQLLKMYSGLSGTAYQGLLTQYFSGTSYLTQHITVESATDTDEPAPHIESENQFQIEIEKMQARAGWLKTPNPQVQYDIVTAPGSTYSASFAEGYCAFHNFYGENVYAFVPYAGDPPFSTTQGCKWYGGGNAANATSSLASHEYAESATDPFWDIQSKFAWQNLEGYEVSDLCATPGAKLPNGSFVQSQYDDHENVCSLADEAAPHILASTDTATGVSSLGAVLHGTVNPEGSATTYQLEYGTSKAYGSNLFPTEREAGAGRSNVAISGTMGALTPETVYHYRVAAKNGNGTTYG